MSEWKEIEINEIIDTANTGLDAIKRAPIVEDDTGIKCMRIQDVSQNKEYVNWGFTKVEARNYEKFQLKKNDLIIARTGATVGVNKFINSDLESVFNNGLIRIRTKHKECLPKFLYYNFRTINFKYFINSISGGTSSQPNMQINVLLSYEIFLPPLPEQKAIAEVLSSLDDKIDLLHRQNKTLEQMAETIFRQWFVEEADESWGVKKLKELVDIGIGRTPPRNQFHWFSKSITDVKWVSIKDLGDSGIFVLDTSEYLTEEAVEKFNIPVIPPDTVLLSFKMTLGRVAITTEYMLSNEAIAHFKFNEGTPFSKEFLYYYLKTYPYETLGSTSSIVTSINSGMIKDMEVIIPVNETLSKFDNQVIEFFDKIRSNQTQIRTLEKMRDTLLPKLMSGEIRITM